MLCTGWLLIEFDNAIAKGDPKIRSSDAVSPVQDIDAFLHLS